MFKKDPLQIIPFRTYGRSSHLYLRGRALEDEDIDLESKGLLKVFLNSWKRFETDEVRYAKLIIKLSNGKEYDLEADAEGYYLLNETITEVTESSEWLSYEVSFNSCHLDSEIQSNNNFKGEILMPSKKAIFGVISDIDDTILHTGVTSLLKWKAILNTIFVTPSKRKAIKGASAMYHRLYKGKTEQESNPIFYVSNSPWNLYRYLQYFLRKNNFPKGPILLRDIRMPYDKTPKPELAHKYYEIYNILKTYPELNFILIGDTGEHDADIYKKVAHEYPERIAAIYLIDVKHKGKRMRIEELFNDYKTSPFLIVENDEQFLRQAQKHGFIK